MNQLLFSTIAVVLLAGCSRQIDIWTAADEGDIERVEWHLGSGVDVDALNEREATSLHIAAAKGKLAVAKLLISRGADLTLLYENEFTPLHLAADRGHLELIDLLVDSGADVNARGFSGFTPLHRASFNNQGAVVSKRLIAMGAVVNAKSKDGTTPLNLAVANGNEKVAKLLLNNNADLNLHKKGNTTPLHNAVHLGQPELVKLLIEKGADINSICESCGQSSLTTAAAIGEVAIAKTLLAKGADVNATGANEATALHVAVEGGHTAVVKLLIEKGAEVNALFEFKRTPLHFAAANGYQEISALLLANGALANAKNRVGQTPLHLAAVGDRELYDLLLANGANDKIWDNSGNTPEEMRTEEDLNEGIGVDWDGDGFDRFDEQITGHSDNDPKDAPTQEEVDKALSERDKPRSDWSDWNRYQETGEAQGWKYGLSKLMGGRPPDAENFFMAKPFNGYLYTQKNGEKPVYLNPKIKEQFEVVKPLLLTSREDEEKMSPADWARFAEQLRIRVTENPRSSYLPADGSDDNVLMTYFSQFDEVISDLREACKRPRQFYPAAWENGFTTSLPHLEIIAWHAKLLQQSASFKLHQNNSKGAMSDASLLFRIYNSIEPGCVNRSVQQSIALRIITIFEIGIDAQQWSTADLAEWNRFFDTDHIPFDSMERALKFERVISLYSLEGTAKGLGGFMFEESMHKSIPLLPKKFVEKELISLDTQMRQLIVLCRISRDAGQLDHDQLAKLSDKTGRGIIATALFPGLKKILIKEGKLVDSFSTATKRLRKLDGKKRTEFKTEVK